MSCYIRIVHFFQFFNRFFFILAQLLLEAVIHDKEGGILYTEKDNILVAINLRRRKIIAIPKIGKKNDTPKGWRWISILHTIQKVTETWCEAGCAVVTDGTCTACTTAVASGCTAVTCATNKFDTNDDATDGCEAGCAVVTDGTCDACSYQRQT